MRKIVLATAAFVLATGAALAQSEPLLSGPNASDRPSTWQTQPLGALDYSASAAISAGPRGDVNSGATVPVYNGLGAGTDDGQYMSLPPIVYGN